MKKIISWVMLFAMLLGMFAGCSKSEEPAVQTTVPATTEAIAEAPALTENNAADVVAYLQAIYKDSGAKTAGDFQRFGIVRIAGVPYEVVWTADVGEDVIKVIVNDDGTVTLDVNEKCEGTVTYTLTATVTDDNGNTMSASWEYTVPGLPTAAEMQATIDQAYALEKGEALTEEKVLYGVISSIDTAYSDQYQNITVTIVVEGREDKPIMCYRLKGEGAADLVVGDTVTVQGLLKNYNNTIEFDAGCQLVTVEKTGTPVEIPSDPHEILNDVYALGENESLPYGPVTLTGRICSIDTPYSEQYKNVTVTIIIDWYTIKCYRMKGEGVEDLEMNDIITVKGNIKKYNGTREFDLPELLDVVKVGEYAQPTDQLHVAKVAYNLDPGWTVPYGDVTLTGTITKVNSAWSDQYENVTVTFVVDGDDKGEYPIECYRMKLPENASKELKAAIKDLAKGDKITVKGILMKYQNTKSGSTKVEFNVPELVSVTKAPADTGSYTKITSASELVSAKYVMVVSNGYAPVALDGTWISTAQPTISGDKVTDAKGAVWTLTVNGGKVKITDSTGVSIKPAGSTSNNAASGDFEWNVTFSNGTFTFGSDTNKLACNTDASTGKNRFRPYKNSTLSGTYASSYLTAFTLYKLEGSEFAGGGESGGESGGTTENVYMTSAPKNGDKVVIVAANYNKALSVTKTGNYNVGVDVAASAGKLTGYADTEVFTVIVNDDGTYSFENGGKNISMAASYSSMNLGEVNDKWKVNSLSDGLFNIVNVGRSGMAMEWYKSYNNWSTYSKNITTDDQFFMAFYLVEAAKEPSPYMTDAPKTGDEVVIVAPNYNKALSVTKTGNYNVGVDVTAAGGKLSGYNTTEVFTVTVNADGTYSFANGGQNIGMASSYSSMNLGAVNDKWKVNSLGDGLFNIVNVGRSGMAMEWYKSYNNWSTYSKNITTDDQFFMAFYLVKSGSGSATPDTPADDATEGTIAQALAAAEGAKYKVKGVVTFKEVTSSSTNLYIQDSTGGICVRVSGTADANLGDTIIATGSKTVYSGLPQLGNATYEKSSGLTLSAENTILDDLYEGFLCKYITIPNLKVTAIDSTNVTLLDDVDVEIKLYKGTYPAELKVGDTITFTGALGIYGTTFQLRNTLASEIVITAAGGSEGGGTDEPVTPPAEPVVTHIDFGTINSANGSSSYTGSYTTASGWSIKNSAIQVGGSSDANPAFKVVGADKNSKAPCLNGKTSAAGSLTSPTLTGGISKLSISYTKMFTDTKLGATITIKELSTGNTYTKTLSKEADKNTKYEVWTFDWVLDTPVKGDFTITIVNSCPSKSSSNKDRLTILDIAWTSAV